VDGGTLDSGPDASIDVGKRDTARDSTDEDAGLVEAGLNGCAEPDFVDRSAPDASRTIAWNFNVDPRCIIVAIGDTVTWDGSLASHPLSSQGGDMPTPIVTTNTGTSVSFVFADAGNFGFVCLNHQPMTGVVRVR